MNLDVMRRKERKVKRTAAAGSRTQDTSGLSHQCSPGSHSVCAVRTPSGVDWKILSIKKEPMLSGFLTLNTVNIEDCEGWWSSGCRGSVTEHWRLKPEVAAYTHYIFHWHPNCLEVFDSIHVNFSSRMTHSLTHDGLCNSV